MTQNDTDETIQVYRATVKAYDPDQMEYVFFESYGPDGSDTINDAFNDARRFEHLGQPDLDTVVLYDVDPIVLETGEFESDREIVDAAEVNGKAKKEVVL